MPKLFREGDSEKWECTKPWNDRPPNVAQIYDLPYTKNVANDCARIRNGSVVQGIQCCNYSHAAEWHLAHPSRTPHNPKSFQFLKIISLFSQTMSKINTPFHIMGGTLLGWARQCGIIPHTTDVDFGIMEEDWNTTKIHNALFEAGFRFKVSSLFLFAVF
jgi:hypothetical protein